MDRYDALRSLGTALKIAAWVVAALGLLSGIGAMIAGQQVGEAAARQALEATGTAGWGGWGGTGFTAGLLSWVLAAIWFLILHALGSIATALADVWHRVTAGEGALRTHHYGEPAYAGPAPHPR